MAGSVKYYRNAAMNIHEEFALGELWSMIGQSATIDMLQRMYKSTI